LAQATKAAAEMLGRRFFNSRVRRIALDDVDLGRQVRGDLEANFLLTNCGLCPNLHDFLLLNNRRTPVRLLPMPGP
jgi:hypothetical protein